MTTIVSIPAAPTASIPAAPIAQPTAPGSPATHPAVLRLTELLLRAEALADTEAVLVAREADAIAATAERILELLPFVELAKQMRVGVPVRQSRGPVTTTAVRARSVGEWIRVGIRNETRCWRTVPVTYWMERDLLDCGWGDVRVGVAEDSTVRVGYVGEYGAVHHGRSWTPADRELTACRVLYILRRFEAELASLPERLAALQATRVQQLARSR